MSATLWRQSIPRGQLAALLCVSDVSAAACSHLATLWTAAGQSRAGAGGDITEIPRGICAPESESDSRDVDGRR